VQTARGGRWREHWDRPWSTRGPACGTGGQERATDERGQKATPALEGKEQIIEGKVCDSP
jgi:hypothetical protein